MECRDLRFYDDFTSVKRFPDAARRADCPLKKSIADVSCLRSRCGAHRKDRALAACPALRAFPKMLDLIQQHAVLAAQPAFELRDSGPTVAAFRVVASDHCRRALAQPVRRSNWCRASGIMGTTNILVPIPDAAKHLNLPPRGLAKRVWFRRGNSDQCALKATQTAARHFRRDANLVSNGAGPSPDGHLLTALLQ